MDTGIRAQIKPKLETVKWNKLEKLIKNSLKGYFTAQIGKPYVNPLLPLGELHKIIKEFDSGVRTIELFERIQKLYISTVQPPNREQRRSK